MSHAGTYEKTIYSIVMLLLKQEGHFVVCEAEAEEDIRDNVRKL